MGAIGKQSDRASLGVPHTYFTCSILGYLCSPNPARDNDVWAWGISLLKGHDPDYVRGTCYRTSDLFTFQDTFPLYGPTGSYKDLITAVDGLQKRFSPIYDHQTYKAEGSKVPKEFFPVLDLLLGRSKGTRKYYYQIVRSDDR